MSSSGVVRILKDLDRSIEGQHVLVVEDIIDSGLTLSWLIRNLAAATPRPGGVRAAAQAGRAHRRPAVRYVGFDIPSAFVVGYGLDYGEHYRTLPLSAPSPRRPSPAAMSGASPALTVTEVTSGTSDSLAEHARQPIRSLCRRD